MFVGVVVFAAGVFYAIENASDKFKFSVLPSEVPMKLPKDASDVDYRWSWGGSRYTADFNISETGFLNWMKEMGLLNRTNRFTTYDNNAWHLLGRSACASVSKVFGTWIQ